ncbi:MAG: ion channel [Lishizhenia sp.]
MTNKNQDPGLGVSYGKKINRLLNENGSFNIKRKGATSWYRDAYSFLIEISGLQFLGLTFCLYLGLNFLFAFFYYLLGAENISGINTAENFFLQCFYLSTQTFTTVGYGGLFPKGNIGNSIATIEAFTGFLSFSLTTGILYGRFSKPNSKISFSKNILLTQHKNNRAVMFKMVNARKNVLLKAKSDVILICDKQHPSSPFEKEYTQLKLEISSINFFPLTWTVVHVIDEKSPFHNLSLDDLKTRNAEIIVLVKAFDETFSQEIYEKHSYAHTQWKENATFKRSFKVTDDGVVELYVNQLHDLDSLPK